MWVSGCWKQSDVLLIKEQDKNSWKGEVLHFIPFIKISSWTNLLTNQYKDYSKGVRRQTCPSLTSRTSKQGILSFKHQQTFTAAQTPLMVSVLNKYTQIPQYLSIFHIDTHFFQNLRSLWLIWAVIISRLQKIPEHLMVLHLKCISAWLVRILCSIPSTFFVFCSALNPKWMCHPLRGHTDISKNSLSVS